MNTRNKLGRDHCILIQQDNYYHDQSSTIQAEGEANFDHPDAIDFVLLAEHLAALKAGQSIDMPLYDFVNRKKLTDTRKTAPAEIVLLDGILILTQQNIVELLDHSFFIECSTEARKQRRIARDTIERLRSFCSVIKQFEDAVLPMHNRYVEPSKQRADTVISEAECASLMDENKGLDIP